MSDRILDTAVSFIPELMPDYHPDAADINEALDTGLASCAARAYGAALLLRKAFPSETLYQIDFGYDPEHGNDFHGENGKYIKMGHAVTRFWVPEQTPVIIESFDDASIELIHPDESYNRYIWAPATEGYKDYLEKADLDPEIDPQNILKCMFMRLQRKNNPVSA